ncbi:MAG: lactate utilization protein C [Opitutales bacterium]
MNDRDDIFSRIRSALEPLPERTPLPDYDNTLMICEPLREGLTTRALFAERLKSVNGIFLDSPEALADLLRHESALVGYCDPGLVELFRMEAFAGVEFRSTFDVAHYEDFTFGITRAVGIAESGTVMLTDTTVGSRLAALSPWLHVAVVRESDLLPHLPAAIERFGNDPNIVWATGPSKTADVEGILIEGVHGPGVQAALIVAD